jgi:hypothetical protein
LTDLIGAISLFASDQILLTYLFVYIYKLPLKVKIRAAICFSSFYLAKILSLFITWSVPMAGEEATKKVVKILF